MSVPAGLLPGWAPAQETDGRLGSPTSKEAAEGASFDRQSLALRTALHHDPSLEAPLERLVDLYEAAGRVDELVTLYRTHVAQYPADAGAHAVLVRLLHRLRRADASSMAALGTERHPDNALLHYLLFEDHAAQRDPRAVDALGRAVSLEPNPGRRGEWLNRLVEQAELWGKPEVAKARLREEAVRRDAAPQQMVDLVRTMMNAGFADLALEALGRLDDAAIPPEVGVEVALLAAEAEALLGRHDAAGSRLDALLVRLAPDYWRRPEIVVRRVHLVESDAAREAMLQEARDRLEREPGNESAVLDLVELLEAADLRRDALDVVLAAADRLPTSSRIERRALELLDRTGDERRAIEFLEKRVEADPGTDELAYRYVKALHAVGDSRRAREVFDRLMEGMPDSVRARQTLELARSVRAMAIYAEAAALFRDCVDRMPDRLDVRRELAEVLVAAGDRAGARALFTPEVAGRGEIENVLDAVQFLVAEGLLREARETLARRLETEPTNFDLQVLLVEVSGKLGERSAGLRWIDSSRALADTGARYARWLENAVAFHELYDSVDSFFDAEEARYAGIEQEWEPDVVARFLVFCEVAKRSQRHEAIASVLRGRIADPTVPEVAKTELRRLLVEVLGPEPSNQAEVQEQLGRLIRDDADNADLYRLRTARLLHEAGRPDLVRQILEEVDLSGIGDADVLSAAQGLFLEYGLPQRSVEALRRLTELEPTTLAYWERWLRMLAATGNEDELRKALRQVLAGATRRELSRDTYALLRAHAADSYWRSIVRATVGAEDADGGRSSVSTAEVFAMLDGVERLLADDPARLWVLWARAWILGKEGHAEARGQLLEQLGREADRHQAEMIVFPDGLSLDLASASSILRDRGAWNDQGGGDESKGPATGAALQWMFRTNDATEVSHLAALGPDAFLVQDVEGRLYALSAASGKLLWTRSSPATTSRSAIGSAGGGRVTGTRTVIRRPRLTGSSASMRGHSNFNAPDFRIIAAPVVDPAGESVFVGTASRVVALDAASGSVVWEADLGDLLPPSSQRASTGQTTFVAPTDVFVNGTLVVAHSPATGVAAGFDARTGKLVWSADVGGEDPEQPPAMASGTAFGHGMLFVFGGNARILDGATGRVLWALSRDNVREFPIRLEEAAVEDPNAAGSGLFGDGFAGGLLSGASAAGRIGGQVSAQYLDFLEPQGGNPYWTRQFIEGRGALVSPGVRWAALLEDGAPGHAVMAGRRLLLMGIDGAVSLSPELPIGAAQFRLNGTFVGSAGSRAVFLVDQGARLAVCHLVTGRIETLSCAKVAERSADAAASASAARGLVVDAVVDSARCYVTGPAGILCINVHTGREIFFVPWPDEAAAHEPDNAEGLDGLPGDDSQSSYFWQGVVRGRQGRPGPCLAPRGAAAEGLLVTVAGPGLVAALGDDPLPDDGSDTVRDPEDAAAAGEPENPPAR